ncbi:MAG: hypothetical protein FWD69_13895 [Polyangiaceae bacterium]|nr:hypothetical protein [Polyangiaceae bacterium]
MKYGYVFGFAFAALTFGVISACSDDSNDTSPVTTNPGTDTGIDAAPDGGMGGEMEGGMDMEGGMHGEDDNSGDVIYPNDALTTVAGEHVKVAVRTENQPPQTMHNNFQLTVTDVDDNPTADLRVELFVVLPGATPEDNFIPGWCRPPNKTVAVTTDADGVCTFSGGLPTAGQWTLNMTFCQGSGLTSCADPNADWVETLTAQFDVQDP